MKHKEIYNRLRRIEGQIRGIEDMVANERPEQELLIQLEAAKSSLAAAIVTLIESMLEIGPDSKVVITEEQIRPILKIIKK